MRPENESTSSGVMINQGSTMNKNDVSKIESSSSIKMNATSTPAITLTDKTVNVNTTTNGPTTNGGHSPSLLPVSVQWLGQNPMLLGKFLEYYKREQFCDCFIWSQEKCFRSHRIILAACSGFFRRIFLKTDTSDQSPCNVVLNDSVSPTDVAQVLDIIYKGSVDAHREDIAALLRCARYLEIHGITLDHLKIVDKLGNIIPFSDDDVEGSDSGYRGTLGDSGMAVDWHSGSSGGRMWSESPRTGSNESAEMRNGVISSSKGDHINGDRVPSRESNKSSREGKGRRKGYRPNRIRMEENLDQQEATDLTSKRRDSLNVLEDQPSQNYHHSKTPRMDHSAATSRSPKPSPHHGQPKQPKLNIRNDLRKQSTALDSTNLMTSFHKGLESFGGENNHQALQWLNGNLSGVGAPSESQAAAILATSHKKMPHSTGIPSDRESSENDVPAVAHGITSQNPLQQTLGIGEGSDFSQRLHQAFLMQVMNQEALRNAATANGSTPAAQAASVYNTAALAAAGGYNSQHWAAMLGMTNGIGGSHSSSSTTNNGLHASSSAFSIPKPTTSSSPQHSSPPSLTTSSAIAYHTQNSMRSSPSMVPLGTSNIPQILGSDSPQIRGIGPNMYETPPIRMGSGRGRGSSGRKVHQLIGENGRPFVKCDICGKCLADPSSLYRHRKIHNGEKPHTCRFCGRKFIQRYNMTQHIKTHFKEKGANSLIANGALREKLKQGELNSEEIAFFMEFTQGRRRFEDPDNPFLRTEDGQGINDGGDGHLLMNGDRDGSPEPEDNYEDEDEEGEMIIDEDPVDHAFQLKKADASPILTNHQGRDLEGGNDNEETIDP